MASGEVCQRTVLKAAGVVAHFAARVEAEPHLVQLPLELLHLPRHKVLQCTQSPIWISMHEAYLMRKVPFQYAQHWYEALTSTAEMKPNHVSVILEPAQIS